MRVRERHRIADPLEHAQARGEVRHLRQVVAKRPPFDALHHVEEPAVCEPAGIVNRHDPRVLEPRQRARLELQPAIQRFAVEAVGNLDCHVAPEDFVAREEDRPHSSASDLLHHRVAVRLELGPVPDAAKPADRPIGEAAHSTSRPNSSRASRRNSSLLPHNPRRLASARSRNRRRTCASVLVTCAVVRPNSAASCA